MSMLEEFKSFALKSNFLDMAIGIVIGGAIGTVVKSLVNDVVMPPIGLLLGGVDFSEIKIPLGAGSDGKDVAMNIGTFINSCISFVIILAAIFMIIKAYNKAKESFEQEEEAAAPAAPPRQEILLEEIRDALKAK